MTARATVPEVPTDRADVGSKWPPTVMCSYTATEMPWRTTWPRAALARQGYPVLSMVDQPGPEALFTIDTHAPGLRDGLLAVFVQWTTPHSLHVEEQMISALHDRGIHLIVDIDDDKLSPNTWACYDAQLHCRQILRSHDPGVDRDFWDRLRRGRQVALQAADGVTVSTPALADVVRTYTNKPVVVVPNVLNLEWWNSRLAGAHRRLRSPVVAWAGNCRPPEVVQPLAEAWATIARKHPDVTFLTVGCSPEPIVRLVPPERLVCGGYVEFDDWPAALAEADIACIAAGTNSLDLSKSNIKVLEFGASGAAVIATHQLYGNYLRDGVDGLLATTPEEWEEAISLLVDDAPRRRRYRRQLRARIVAEQSIARECWKWPAAWRAILGKDVPKSSTEAALSNQHAMTGDMGLVA